jgi:transcriptional regulator with XRE-family HTH domain
MIADFQSIIKAQEALMKYDEMDIKIGAVLKKYRKEKRLTIRKIGDILGINNSTVSKWESGINAISAKDLLHYLDILGITYEQFIEDLKAMDGELTS